MSDRKGFDFDALPLPAQTPREVLEALSRATRADMRVGRTSSGCQRVRMGPQRGPGPLAPAGGPRQARSDAA